MDNTALFRRTIRSKIFATWLIAVCLAPPGAAGQSCVGDCNGDGEVTVDEIIVGVNIALEAQPLGNCPKFDRDGDGMVLIDEIISAVGYALNSCPVVPTNTPAAPTATSTLPPTPAPTSTPTASAINTPQPTSTVPPSATNTPQPTATRVPPSATASATQTLTPQPTATSGEPSPTVTDERKTGEYAAGRVNLIVNAITGLNGMFSSLIVGLVGSGSGGSAGDLQSYGVLATTADNCPISGTKSNSCTNQGLFNVKVMVTANACKASGPAGGTATFDGSISLTGPGYCPVPFGGNYVIDVTVEIVPAQGRTLDVDANLTGTINADLNLGSACLIDGFYGTLNGTVRSTLPDGTGSVITFKNTAFNYTALDYNEDCVPLRYSFKLNGGANIGNAASGTSDAIVFSDFLITQDARTEPVSVEYGGGISSTCVGTGLSLSTLSPVAIAAGEICPRDGEVLVSNGGDVRVRYLADESVQIDTNNDGIPEASYDSCLAPELMACTPPPEG